MHHLSQHQHNELTQSAYRHYHGTETALTRVQNYILPNADKGHIYILISLDLSAAFDALDHQILLQILLQRLYSIGLTQKTLNWFKSYLTDRYQTVRIIKQNEIGVSTYPLIHGVPQGSVLGPILFNPARPRPTFHARLHAGTVYNSTSGSNIHAIAVG